MLLPTHQKIKIGMKIIDTHQHFWNYNPKTQEWINENMKVIRKNFLPEDIAPLLKENKVEGCVTVQADQSIAETNFLIQAAKNNTFIKGVVGWIDLKDKKIEQNLEFYKKENIVKGFRHIIQAEPTGFMQDLSFQKGLTALAKYNYTYDLLDNSNVVAGSLASYVGKIVKLILPTSLTGLPDPVLTCVQVTTLSSCNSCTTHDLVVVTSNFISCDQCVKCYTATRCDNPNISVHIQTQSLFFTSTVGSCTDLCKDCQTTAYISLPEGADPSCWIVTNKCANVDLPTYNIDLFNSPTYELTCSPDPCGACNSTCYRVVSCDGTFQITLMNPTLVGASIVILDTPVQINVSTGDPLTQYFSGCAIITELDPCNPIGNTFPATPSEITYVLDSGDQPVLCSCDPPPPPTFKITRCDDFGIFFIVSTDLSSTIGNVISGVNIINCSPTVGLCSSIKPEQCWLVSISSIPSTLEMTYANVYPNCECCYKPCN